MAAVQLSFSLRTSSSVKTVHLLGSWDNYSGQLPLSKDKTSSKSGAFKGTFRFQGATLEAGQRYWYYYIIDGYHVSHDPAQASTTEPTTGRVLNILDVPSKSASKSSSKSSSKHSSKDKTSSSSRRESRREADIPKGRPLSVSQIVSPKPVAPHATQYILATQYSGAPTVEDLTSRFSQTTVGDYDDYELSSSPPSSVGSSLSSRSDSSSPSSVSSVSDYSDISESCTCERYGITRKGDRVKLDCGGSRCSYTDDDSCCSSGEEDYVSSTSSRRNGLVIRR